MKATLEAVYKDGVLRPVQRLAIADGVRVRITVESLELAKPEDPIELFGQVYRGCSAEDIDDIERVALDRDHFFARHLP